MRFCCRERVVDRGQRDLTFLAATVFAAADQLWTNSALRPDQYAQPVLALIALRQMEPSSRPSTPSWLPTTRGGSSQRRVTTKRAARSSSPRTRGSLGFCHYPAQRTSPRREEIPLLFLGRAERFERAARRVSRSVSLATPSTLLLEGDLACWVATVASLQKQRRSREVWCRHVYSQLKASSDRAI
jgi:hypothetical protein